MNDVIYLLNQNAIDDIVMDRFAAIEIRSRINNYPEIMEGYYSFTEEDYRRVTALLEDKIIVTDVVQSEFEGVKIVQVSYNTDTSIDADEEDYTMEIEEIERQEKDELEKRLKFQEIDKELEKAGVSVASYTTEYERISEEEIKQYERARRKVNSRQGAQEYAKINVEFGEMAKKYKEYQQVGLRDHIYNKVKSIFRRRVMDKKEMDIVVHLLNGFVRKPKDDGKIHIFVNSSPVSKKDANKGEVDYYYGPKESLGYGEKRLAIPKFGKPVLDFRGSILGVVVGLNIYLFHDPMAYSEYSYNIIGSRIAGEIRLASDSLLITESLKSREDISSRLTGLIKNIIAYSNKENKEDIDIAKTRKETAKRKYLEASREYQNTLMKYNKPTYSKEETEKELNYLLKDKNIVRFWIEGAKLKAQTRTMVIASPRTGELHRIGRLEISVDIDDQEVTIKNLEYRINPGGNIDDGIWDELPTEEERDRALIKTTKIGFDAPHVESGYPCFGNMATAITQLMAENQYGSLISLAANYLETAELGDEYGAGLHYWPVTTKEDFEKDLKEDAETRQAFLADFEEENINVESEKQCV